MLITEDLEVNGFEFQGDGKYIKKEGNRTFTITLLDDIIHIDIEEPGNKKPVIKSDEIDSGMLQRLEVNRGMSNPLNYVLSQLVSYGTIQKC